MSSSKDKKDRLEIQVVRVRTPDLRKIGFDDLTMATLRKYVQDALEAHPGDHNKQLQYYLQLVEIGLPTLAQDLAAARAALSDDTVPNLLVDMHKLTNKYRLLLPLILGRSGKND